ncbi:rhotekin-2-like isoform X4 [Gigantopelta aegis]|uniref:rhotekin-2-like isoform X3 n=1 Tax=Gigantopelta aegis TaxID=1735272 RepID=UPI001B88DA75|nr:rhotekin-2-like isoform X3 [Gigantopelta aegis]XP_041370424.1 rhotekin-2-like isoform X4 [Gigantopelta aegis]
MDDLDLSFTVQGCGLLSSKRRKSVCSSSIKRLQTKRDPERSWRKSDVSKKSPFGHGTLKRSLKRRMSMSITRHKMKTSQDYSLHGAGDATIVKSVGKPSTVPSPLQTVPSPFHTVPSLQTAVSIAQRSHRCRLTDHDLKQKIDHEMKMREGTAKLLAASRHPPQLLEAAKNLLTSNTRIYAYMQELQKRKTDEVMGKNQSLEGNQLPCSARVSVSDLRIPLMWKDSDHFKNKGDYRRYAVFCLLKIGTEIFDTSMISNVDRSMTDITFDDVIVFNNIGHDFECKVEIYCHKLHEDLSIANTPKKLRKKINDLSGSVGRSVGKRLSGLNDADIIGNMVLGPKFDLVARGSLQLSDVDESVRTFDVELEKNADGVVHELPLFGHYCCRLAAVPQCLVETAVTGYLNIQEDDDLSKWKRYWCVLKNLHLACWSSPSDVEVAAPLLTVSITKNTQISDADPATCNRSHTFHIKTVSLTGVLEHTLAADSHEDFNRWWDGFQQHLLDQALWKHVCDFIMDVPQTSLRKNPAILRKSSLYDDTPLIGRS